jgi:hypothetical protein
MGAVLLLLSPLFSPLQEVLEFNRTLSLSRRESAPCVSSPREELSLLTGAAEMAKDPQYLQWNLPQAAYRRLLSLGEIAIPPALDDSHWLPLCLNDSTTSSFFLKTHWKMLLLGLSPSSLRPPSDSSSLRATGRRHVQSPGHPPHRVVAGEG